MEVTPRESRADGLDEASCIYLEIRRSSGACTHGPATERRVERPLSCQACHGLVLFTTLPMKCKLPNRIYF